MNNLKIAIQKNGRLTDQSIKLLKSVGLVFDSYERQLSAKCKKTGIEIMMLRDDDIPEFVEREVVNLGIVGSDVIGEQLVNVSVLKNLGFGKCKLGLAVPESSKFKSLKDLNGCSIATSFPNLTRKYLKQANIDANIIEIKGSVELAPNIGLADSIVDLVSTGFTLKTNNLKVVQFLEDFETVLIGNQNQGKSVTESIQRLLMRIDASLFALNYKYIMLNVPEKKLRAVSLVSPGLKSPTVTPLSKKGWLSVQTVIESETFWEVLEKLKIAGAEDIVVMPIEQLVK